MVRNSGWLQARYDKTTLSQHSVNGFTLKWVLEVPVPDGNLLG